MRRIQKRDARSGKETMKCIQINLNHCEAAQDLLTQTVKEEKADLALICEQYKTIHATSRWVDDSTKKAAIWTCGKYAFERKNANKSPNFAYAKIKGIHFFSCYAPPSATMAEYQQMLDVLVAEVRGKSPAIVAGDFNAWAVEWGSTRTNHRGEALLDAFASLDLVLLNQGNKETFNNGRSGSIIDLTFASRGIARKTKWHVSDLYTNSDHRAIIFETTEPRRFQYQKATEKVQKLGWKSNNLDKEMLDYWLSIMEIPRGTAEEQAKQVTTSLTRGCDASMPRKGNGNGRTPVYWWNDCIAKLRADCLKMRRRQQRARQRQREDSEEIRKEFVRKRKELRKLIKKSKTESFQSLREDLQHNPWGSAYKIVMDKLKSGTAAAPKCPTMMNIIVSGLFPRNTSVHFTRIITEDAEPIQPVTTAEVLEAAGSMKSNKAPGMDGIPNLVLKEAIKTRPEVFANLYTRCLAEGKFPLQWKRQRLVLIPKGDKPPEQPSSYRPLCMLDTVGKVLERIIRDRLDQYTEGDNGLSNRQYGFRKKRSTTHAIQAVCEIAREAISGTRWKGGRKQYCAVVTLDIKNAFNSASWNFTMRALRNIRVPNYLLRIITNYFEDRTLFYDTDEGPKRYKITKGVPQGSVLGPALWNVMYDGVLRMRRPRGVDIIGYADDIAVVVVAKTLEEVTQNCNNTIKDVKIWLRSAGLELADHKTEAVLISSRKKVERLTIQVGEHTIESKPYIKYLGVLLDHRLNFREHLTYTSVKANRAVAAISRLMPNIGGPRQPIRNLLATVSKAILMYAAPIWAPATAINSYMRSINSVHRRASIRVCCAYRTVSGDAISVIAARMPIDLEVKVAASIYNGENRERRAIRAAAEIEWQRRWNTSENGRWTYKLLPNIEEWTRRKHGEVNFYLTQLLTGHGSFREFLYKYDIADDPFCRHCEGKVQNAEHVLLECIEYVAARNALEQVIGNAITPRRLISFMLSTSEAWDTANRIIASIMQELRRENQTPRAQEEGNPGS